MPAPSTQTFSQLVSNTVAAIQGAATTLLDLTVGSVLRAFVDAFGLLALWLQGMILQTAALTRLSTSFGKDADSFCADFGFQRLPSQPATGQVTFARFTPTQQASIVAAAITGQDAYGRPIYVGGTIVQTQDGTQQYQVIPDTQAAYSPGLNAYILSGGVSSTTATVQAVTAGSASNASAAMISALGSAIPFVDTVTNAAPFTNGANAESDPSFKARFVLWINSLSSGTVEAVESAVLSVAQNVTCEVVENFDYSGMPRNDYFYVVVNDGTGAPSSGFLSTVSNAIETKRPIATGFAVFAPVVVIGNVALVISVASNYLAPAVQAAVLKALQDYIASLTLGETLPWSRLVQVAYDASAGVTNVTGVTINGATSDLTASVQQVIVLGTTTVTVAS